MASVELLEVIDYKDSIHDLETTGSPSSGFSTFHKRAADIRKNKIDWTSYLSGQFVDTNECNFIQRYTVARSPQERTNIINENSELTVQTFISLVTKIKLDTTVQYLLTVIDDMLQEEKGRVELFNSSQNIFLRFLRADYNPYIKIQASRIITKIACWSKQLMRREDVKYYFQWLCEQIDPINDFIQTLLRNLQMMLRIPQYRGIFIETGNLSTLTQALLKKLDTQCFYQLIFCLWCLSFDKECIVPIYQQRLIPILANILNEINKEKVIRMTLAVFRHLLEKLPEAEQIRESALTMIHCRILQQLKLYKDKNIEDEELQNDLDYLLEKLQFYLQDVSTFDEYVTELQSGRLDWTPSHESVKFWSENVTRFNEKNHSLLKMLVRLLENSNDPTVLSVAVHDLGQYVRHYPRGKQLLEQLGGKKMIMTLLVHSESIVRYHALIALQKIMVQNWEYLGKQLDADKSKAQVA